MVEAIWVILSLVSFNFLFGVLFSLCVWFLLLFLLINLLYLVFVLICHLIYIYISLVLLKQTLLLQVLLLLLLQGAQKLNVPCPKVLTQLPLDEFLLLPLPVLQKFKIRPVLHALNLRVEPLLRLFLEGGNVTGMPIEHVLV